jgi:hypothetical protein
VKPFESWLLAMAEILALCGIGLAITHNEQLAQGCLAFALLDVVLAVALAVAGRIWK